MTLEQAIEHVEEVAEEQEALANKFKSFKDCGNPKSSITSGHENCKKCTDEHRQFAEWLIILKKAKFEYDEAWRIITYPTPDVTYADRNRAQIILDTFRNSLGKMEGEFDEQ